MRRSFLLAMVGLGCWASAALVRAESASVLLEKGIHLEETVGDLDGAIGVYRQIVADAEANRRYAAQAQLHIGLCLLKKKQETEARAALEKLIADFADQKELVAQARKHLPSPPFPDVEGCRLQERITLSLEPPRPGWGEAEPTQSFSVSEYAILDVHWQFDPALAARVSSFVVHLDDYAAHRPSGEQRSTTFGDPQKEASPLKAGKYTLRIGGYAGKKDNLVVDSEGLVVVGVAKVVVAPLPYTQIMIDDIQPDGTIRFRSVSQKLNGGVSEQTSDTFVNSDFIHLERMTDDGGKPLQFTTEHSGGIYRYRVTLNQPVPPGKAFLDACEGTVSGMIQPVSGGKDEFQHSMEHWPSVNEPTRRIEIYRLPKGAELLETEPKDAARRETNGRTEICFQKMIPARGSIATSFKYRLAGAKLAATRTAGAGERKEPLKLNAAPWVDGERLALKLSTPVGVEIGQIVYTAQGVKADGKDAWRIESAMFITAQNNMEQYTCVDAQRDSFAPITGRTKNSMLGDFRAEYGSGLVKLVVVAGGKETAREIGLESTAYDNEQALYLIRRMPLAESYRGSFPIFPVAGGGSVIECRIEVQGKEKVTVPAGTFQCYKTDLFVYAGELRVLQHQVWFSADKHQYPVKYDSGAAVMELTETATLRKSEPASFADKEMGFSLTAPVGWEFYRWADPGEFNLRVQLIPPEMKAWAALLARTRKDDDRVPREVAEKDSKRVAEKAEGVFENYRLRPDGWTEGKVSGLPAARYAADYKDKGRDMVEYRTYVLGESMVYWFVFRAEKDRSDALRPEFDAVMKGFAVTRKGG